ncbi:MAG: DHHA1 domain-containing protein [Candidatus Thorarchaeota archaeon]
MRYTEDELSRTVLITHRNCSDGSGSAVVFLLAGGRKENIYYVPAGNGVKAFAKKNLERLIRADRVIVADVATDPETADMLNKIMEIVIIDHHKTALNLADKKFCHINMTACGTYLLYEYLYEDSRVKSNAIEQFASLINDRDMWICKEPMSDKLSMFANFFGQEKFVGMMEYRIRHEYPLLNDSDLELVKALQAKREQVIAKQLEYVTIREVDGNQCGYVFLSDYQSETLGRMLERFPIDVAVGIKMSGAVVSIRTTSHVDATLIAQAHGGGGHARAAGHSLDTKTLREILEVIHP